MAHATREHPLDTGPKGPISQNGDIYSKWCVITQEIMGPILWIQGLDVRSNLHVVLAT